MTSLSNCKEGVRTGSLKGTRFGFLLAVLLMFIAMMIFIPGRDIMLSGGLASANKSAKPTAVAPAPQGEIQCNNFQGNSCYQVDPPSFNKIARAGSDEIRQFTVRVNAGCEQIVARLFSAQASAPDWIEDVRVIPAIDDRFLTITFIVRRNRNKERKGSIELLREREIVACVPISQDGCTYELSPKMSEFLSADGQEGPDITVTTMPDNECDYEVRTGSGFVEITSGAGPNRGPTTVKYKVKPNASSTEQKGFITISEKTAGQADSHEVNQLGKTITPGGCNYSLSDPRFTFQAGGGERTFQVQTSDTCDWTAVSEVPWITLLDQQNNVQNEITGKGNGNVKFRVGEAASPRPDGAIAILNAQRQPVTRLEVIQFGRTGDPTNPCSTIPILPQSAPADFSATGGEGSFELEASAGCSWTAKPNVSWIKVKDAQGNVRDEVGGSGRRTITYVVGETDTQEKRPGRIDIQDGTGRLVNAHSLEQRGRTLPDPTCDFTIPTPEAFVGEGGGTFAFTVDEKAGSVCDLSPDSGTFTWISTFVSKKNGEWQYKVDPWNNTRNDETKREGEIKIGDKTYRVTQFSGGASGRSTTEDCPSNLIRLNQVYNGTLSRETARPDCTSKRKSGFRVDNYKLALPERTRVAINVAAVGFDPTITLFKGADKIDNDDGSGFRNARLPRLPRQEEFIALEAGEYTIEISSFQSAIVGSYALYIASDIADPAPVILGAAVEGETLLVIGENFDKGAKVFIGESTKKEPSTKNAQSRKRTALVALVSGTKVKAEAPVSLRVVNKSGRESARFVFPKQ